MDRVDVATDLQEIKYVSGAQIVARASYPSFDPNGNILRETREKLGTAGSFTEKVHTYEALDRLSSSRLVIRGAIVSDHAFSYSGSGNLMSAGARTYGYTNTSILAVRARS